MEESRKVALEEFRKSVTVDAEKAVFTQFPDKIISLQKLIESTANPNSPWNISNAVTSTDTTIYPPPTDGPDPKKRKREESENLNVGVRFTGQMLRNPRSVEIHTVVKDECSTLNELCDKVKLWINLTMPRIEDGDNFGVQVQEEVLAELIRSQQSADNLRDCARADHLTRAKICSKILKYPHLEDYILALEEHDEKQIYNARQHLLDIRNIYAILTDLIVKNITKIRAPKGNNSRGLY